MGMTSLAAWLRSRYDRIIAVVALLALLASLLYLGLKVGSMREDEERFYRWLDGLRPKHEVAAQIDPAPFQSALQRIDEPLQIRTNQWTGGRMFVAETRVTCVDCTRPIPYSATNCPFCKAQQPIPRDIDPERDLDKDGMKDVWELDNLLDPKNPQDALEDPDGDTFTNLEEFRANPKTNPRDPNDHPSVEALLCVTAMTADPFKLKFKSYMRSPDLVFGINTKSMDKTYFATNNQVVEGFRITKFEEKKREGEIPGSKIKTTIDESVLTLQRGERLIPLVLGKEVAYSDYTAKLLFKRDKSTYTVKPGGTFKLLDKQYRVMMIDSDKKKVLIVRLDDNKEFEVLVCPEGGGGREEPGSKGQGGSSE